MAQRILGLDIGKASIKAVVLQQAGRQPQVEAYHIEAIPLDDAPDATDVEAVRKARQEALGKVLAAVGAVDQIITSLPGSVGASAALELPFSDAAKIDQILGFQLDEISPFEIEDLLYDYQYIDAKKDAARLLVGSAPRAEVAGFLAELQEAQVDPRILTLEGLAYAHLFPQLAPIPDEPIWGVLDLGFRHTTLTLFQRDTNDTKEPVRTVLVRTIPRGTRQLRQAVVTSLDTDAHQAHQALWTQTNLAIPPGVNEPPPNQAVQRALMPILTELRRSHAAIQRQSSHALQTLYITGGGALLPGMAEYLSQRLALRVLPLRLEQIPVVEGIQWPQIDAPFQKALALALRAFSRSRFTQINLRKNEFAFKGDLQFLKDRLGSLFVGSAILFVLLMISIFTGFYALAKEKGQLQSEVEKRCQAILGQPISNPSRCITIMLEEIQKAAGSGDRAIIPTLSAYDIFLEVYDRVSNLTKNQKIKIEITSIRITARNFELEGETDSFAAASMIHQNLKTYRCFEKMPEGRVQKAAGKKGKFEFRLNSPLSC
jgi:general secretion pathway protein L